MEYDVNDTQLDRQMFNSMHILKYLQHATNPRPYYPQLSTTPNNPRPKGAADEQANIF